MRSGRKTESLGKEYTEMTKGSKCLPLSFHFVLKEMSESFPRFLGEIHEQRIVFQLFKELVWAFLLIRHHDF